MENSKLHVGKFFWGKSACCVFATSQGCTTPIYALTVAATTKKEAYFTLEMINFTIMCTIIATIHPYLPGHQKKGLISKNLSVWTIWDWFHRDHIWHKNLNCCTQSSITYSYVFHCWSMWVLFWSEKIKALLLLVVSFKTNKLSG